MAAGVSSLLKVRCSGPAGGVRGSGWLVGTSGILTARHVVEASIAGGPAHSCRVVLGSETVPLIVGCSVIWDDPARDLALLRVADADLPAWASRLTDVPPTVLAEPGEQPVRDVVICGYPQSSFDDDTLRANPTQESGTLNPGGGPPGRSDFEVDGSVPEQSELWQGISGAALMESGDDPRLLAVVTDRTEKFQNRRLEVVLLPDPDTTPAWSAALVQVGARPVVESFDRPLRRAYFREDCLTLAGRPLHVRDLPGPGWFGTRPARDDIPHGGDDYFEFVDRPERAQLASLLAALVSDVASGAPANLVQPAARMIVLVGDSAAGKSRLAAQVVLNDPALQDRQILHPNGRPIRDLPLRLRSGPCIVWIDNLHDNPRVLTGDTVSALVSDNPQLIVIATILSDALAQLTSGGVDRVRATGGLASAGIDTELGSLLTNPALVTLLRIEAKPDWIVGDDTDSARVAALAAASGQRIGLGEYLAAYDQLALAYQNAQPVERALVDAVADWGRIGSGTPLDHGVVQRFWLDYLDSDDRADWDDDTDERRAQTWNAAVGAATSPVLGSTALIRERRTGFQASELARNKRGSAPIDGAMWEFALASLTGGDVGPLLLVGFNAAQLGEPDIARRAFLSTVKDPDSDATSSDEATAMFALGSLAQVSDPDTATTWFRRSAAAGNIYAIHNLGFMIQDSDPEAAIRLYEEAARGGYPLSMNNLAVLLERKDPEVAKSWYRKAADGGVVDALVGLGSLILADDPQAAAKLFEEAAAQGDTHAMYNLGFAADRIAGDATQSPDTVAAARATALGWFRKAAEGGYVPAMFRLGVLLVADDVDEAAKWYRKAADGGEPGAMFNLALLEQADDPADAQDLLRRAAESGYAPAMNSLGLVLMGDDRTAAREWFEKGANAGDPRSMSNFGALLQDVDEEGAKGWYLKAAKLGFPTAMVNLGMLLAADDKDQASLLSARDWFQKASLTGNQHATELLGGLLATHPELAGHRT